ncbi:GOR1 Glyoxylate reductase 1 [Candida maltosa Xu316]
MTSDTISKPKVLLVGDFEHSRQRWKQLESIAEVIYYECQTRDQLKHDLQTKYNDVTCIAKDFFSFPKIGRFDADLAQYMPKSLKTLSHAGAGYDQVEVDAFTKLGVQVSNVTEPVIAPTADTAVFLVLSCMRRFLAGRDMLKQGKWPEEKPSIHRSFPMGMSPEGKVLGILGMGGIGRAIRDKLTPFGFEKIVYYNRSQLSPELEKGTEYVSLDELFRTADVIVIGIPLNKNTRHLINKEAVDKMKDGVVLVNIARGAIIDEKILPGLLKSGKIGAFGADVFETEPRVSPELYDLPNAVCTPHMGCHTAEDTRNIESWAADCIEHYINTGKLKTIVSEQKALGASKHSSAFRRAMVSELRPLRSYSVEQPSIPKSTSKLAGTKEYLKKLQTEDTPESENMLKIFRKIGAVSVVVVFASIGIAAYKERAAPTTVITEEVIDIPMDLSQDIRYQKRA